MPDSLTDVVASALINLAHYAGLTVALGAITLRVLVLSRCGLTVSERAPKASEAARAGMWGAVLLLVAAPLRALNQVRTLVEPDESWLPVLQGVLGTSLGRALLLQAIWAAAAIVAFLVARQGRDRGWKIATIALVILALTPGLTGHAATAASPALALAAATAHVWGAGLWIGGLFHLWRLTGRASDLTLRRALAAFHPVAMVGVALLVMSGLNHAWSTLGPLANLVETSWGRLLSLKLALVLAVLALGYQHWRSSERAVEAGDRSGLRQSIGREALLALAVMVVTAVLTSTQKPL
jgi:copper transport protein